MDLAELREAIRKLLEQRKGHEAVMDNLEQTATRENRGLNADEAAPFRDAREAIAKIDGELDGTDGIEGLIPKRDRLELEQKTRELRTRQMADLGVPQGGAVVTRAEQIYRPDGDWSFFADQFRSQVMRDGGAMERLGRFEAEQRDVVGSAFTGAIPPQYLVDQFAPVVRAGSPFWNALNRGPLFETGLSAIVPRGTTGSAAAAVTEGGGFNEQDMANADDTVNVNLFGAQQDISRAIFMRGGPVVDMIIFPDLMSAYYTALDSSIINGNGTAPNHRGVRNVSGISTVTYNDASPTVPELWPKLQDAIQRVNGLRFAGATLAVMHPRRWGWLLAGLDGSSRPVFEASAQIPQNAMGLGDALGYGSIIGSINGQLPVVTDANIPTNVGAGTEDVIVVMRSFDFLALQDGDGTPTTYTFEQTLSTAPGQVRLAVGGFSMFHAGRYPTGISVITGTGLIAPTF